jgi:uncharacterized protein (TIGR02391 family)
MKTFYPTADQLLAADRDQLAETVLRHLKTYEGGGTVHQYGGYNPDYYVRVMEGTANGLGSLPIAPEYGDQQSLVSRRIREALHRLEMQGHLMRNPEQPGPDWFVITSEGEQFLNTSDGKKKLPPLAITQMLPKDVLHPKISGGAFSAFMRGEFDVAAFQAMKAVEVLVREAAGFGNNLVGVPLMHEAFSRDKGPLTDLSSEPGERVARMELFAGAIGSYKNPHSHRDVDLNEPLEVVEIILLANHLLRIVDARAKAKGEMP